MEEKRVIVYGEELYHYGTKGQKWGVRRFQTYDGTYTVEGKIRYFGANRNKNYDGSLTEKGKKHYDKAYNKFKKFALKTDKDFRKQVKEKEAIDEEVDRKRQKKIDRAVAKADFDGDDPEVARQEAEAKFEKKLSKSSLGDRKFKTDSALMKRAEEKVRGFLGDDYNLINSETSKKLGEEYVTMLLSDAKNYNPLAAIFW